MEYQEKLIILPAMQDMKEPMTVTAYEAVGTGLCYNAIGGDERNGWVITHLSSKKYLCNPVSTEYEARLLLEKATGIADWNQDEKELLQPKIANEFNSCQTSVRQELNMQLESALKQSNMPEHLRETIMYSLDDDVLRNALLYAFKIVDKSSDLS